MLPSSHDFTPPQTLDVICTQRRRERAWRKNTRSFQALDRKWYRSLPLTFHGNKPCVRMPRGKGAGSGAPGLATSFPAHLVSSCFFLFHFAGTAFFTNWRLMATWTQASLWTPFFQQHLLTSCLCVTFWYFHCEIFQTFSLLFHLWWWSVYSGLCCYYSNSLKGQMMVNIF